MVPPAFWAITLFVCGTVIGSFLTAAIYRLPRGLSLLEPQRSMCPNCKHSLNALDLVPLLSFLLSGQKCRYCKQPISWRYFGIELVTGLTFVAVFLKYHHVPQEAPDLIALLAFTAVLIPIFFIDLETFSIPISLNLLASVIPLARDIWGIAHHELGHELIGGWLPRSILGGLIGALILGLLRIFGWLYKGVEAMGLGDVYLARGMGGMLLCVMPVGVAYGSFLIWLLLASLSGIVVGPLLILLRRSKEAKEQTKNNSGKNSKKVLDRYGNPVTSAETIEAANNSGISARSGSNKGPEGSSEGSEGSNENSETLEALDPFAREGSFVQQLRDVAEVLIGYDAYEWTRYTFDRKYRARWDAEAGGFPAEDDFVPAPTAIPFGPFLVIGFLLTAFFGATIIHAYLGFAHLLPEQNRQQ